MTTERPAQGPDGGVEPIVEFILEVEKLKGVTRRTRTLAVDRYENSAEHSWQLAMLAAPLAPFAPEAVDVNRVIRMLLVHDVGEIDAGDAFVYASDGWDAHKAAERAAVQRIFGLLPEPHRSESLTLWEEFEDGRTPEARFAHAVDRAMPVLLNLANKGQSWRENGIPFEQVVARVGPAIDEGCPALWRYIKARLDDAQQRGWFGSRRKEANS